MTAGQSRIRFGRGPKTVGIVLGLGGAVLFTALLLRTGLEDVAVALQAAGWAIFPVALFNLVPMAMDTEAWRWLIDRKVRPAFWRLMVIRWIGGAVNGMLPAAQVGGDIVRARLLLLGGVPGQTAAACVLADLTVGLLSQAAFTVIGLVLLLHALGEGAVRATGPVILAVFLGILLFAAFYGFQRLGLFSSLIGLVARMVRSGAWATVVEQAEAFDRTLEAIYRRRRAVAVSFLWALAAWIAGAGEVWLAFWVLGSPITVAEAVILESVTHAVRSAMFLVPGALGVQEGGILVVSGMLGLPPQTALAMALIKRVREILLGVPGLFAWQFIEGRRALRRQSSPGQPGDGDQSIGSSRNTPPSGESVRR